jgi:hypothetical protein
MRSATTDATATLWCLGSSGPARVEHCLAALGALADDPGLEPGRRDGTGAFIALEPTAEDAGAGAIDRADLIRKFGDFTDASPVLLRAAMSARLHIILDTLNRAACCRRKWLW